MAFWLEFQPRNSRLRTALSTLTRHMDRAGGGRRRGQKLRAAVVRSMGRRRRGRPPNCSRKAGPSTLRTQPAASLARGISLTPGGRVRPEGAEPQPPSRSRTPCSSAEAATRRSDLVASPERKQLRAPPFPPGGPHRSNPASPRGHGSWPPSPFLSTATGPHPTELHSKPHTRSLADGTQTPPGCPARDAIKFSQVGGSARRHAPCQVQQTQPPAHDSALGDGVSSSTLNWARKATGEHPTGGEQPSPIKYNWTSAKPKMYATVLKGKKKNL